MRRGQVTWEIREMRLARHSVESLGESVYIKREPKEQVHDLLQALMDSIPDAIYFKDTTSRFIRINWAHAERMGLNDPREAIGKTDFDFYPEKFALETYADEQNIMKTGKALIGKIEKIEKPNGQFLWISATKVPIKDKNGDIKGVAGISRDITEQKKAEEALKESEEKYRTQFDEALDAIFVADAETGIIIDCNRAASELVGREKPELVGKHQRILHSSEEIEGKISRTFKQHLKEKEGQVLETQVITKKGEIKDVAITANVFELPGKKLIQGIFRDITERKKVEEKIKKISEEWEKTFDAIADSVFIIDKDFRFIRVNMATCDVVKKEPKELIGKHCFEILHCTDKPWPNCPHKKTLITKKATTEEINDPHLGIPLLVTVSPIFDEQGELTASVHIAKVITERKKAEEAMKKSESKLRSILSSLADMVFVFDKEDRFTLYHAPPSSKIYVSPEKFMGKTLYEVMPPHVHKPFADAIKKNRKGESAEFEYQLEIDGQTCWFSARMSPMLLNGKFVGYVAVVRDITERKRAEEALRESEEKFRMLAEQSPNMIFVNKKGRVVYTNKRCEEVMGYKREEFYSPDFNFLTLSSREHVDLLKSNFTRHMKGEEVPPYEFILVTKEGKKIETILATTLIKYGGETAILGILTDITERKREEEKILESEERFKAIFDNAVDGILIADSETKKFYVGNRMICQMLGYSPKDVTNLGVMDIHPLKDLSYVIEQFEKQSRGEITLATNIPVKRNDGSIFYADVNSALISLGGKPYLMGIFRDITERKRMEEALKESEEKFRTFMETASDLMHIADKDGNLTYVNKSMAEALGYSKEEMIGMHITRVFGKETLKTFKPKLRELITKGRINLEVTWVTKNGKEICVEGNAVGVYDGDGTFAGSKGIFRDITEHKKAIEEIEDGRKKLRDIIDAMADSVCIADLDAKITMVNKVMEDLFEIPKEKMLTMNGLDLVVEEDIAKVSKAMQDLFKSGLPQNAEVTGNIGGAKGKPFWIRFSFLKDERGEPKGIVAVTRDVTESKKMIKALIEANSMLEWLMKNLKDANERLEQSNNDLENYTYAVSHDLKTPLRAIRSFSTFLMEDYGNKLDEAGQDYLKRIADASSHLDDLIEDLLVLSRVGRKFTRVEKVDLNQLLSEIEADLKPLIEARNAEVVFNGLPTISVQRTWMKQMLMNLIDNGLKFNKSKTPKIEVLYEDRERDYLFKVQDNGVGIKKKYFKRLFRLFERLHAEDEYEGTGAGLAICKRIVEHWGGKIWVESTLGKGSTFLFAVPKKGKTNKEKAIKNDTE